MKLICGQCSAKYTIADEKARGTAFKIRCKKCENLIVVDGQAEGPPVVTGGVAMAAEAGIGYLGEEQATATPYPLPGGAEPAPAIWYLVLAEQQVGPFTPRQVEEFLQLGQATGESLSWREGLSSWVPLETLTEFEELIRSLHATPAIPEAAPQAPTAAPGPLQPAIAMSPIPGSSAATAAPAAASSLPSPADQPGKMIGARNENSALFSLSTLQNLTQGSTPAAGPAPVGEARSSSGVIDIHGYGRAGGGALPPVALPATLVPVEIKSRPPYALYGLLIGVVLLLIGVLVVVLWRFQQPVTGPTVVVTGGTATATAAPAPASLKESLPAPAPGTAETATPAPAAGSASPAPGSGGPAVAERPSGKGKGGKTKGKPKEQGREDPGAEAPQKAEERATGEKPGKTLEPPEVTKLLLDIERPPAAAKVPLTRDQVRGKVQGAMGGVRGCYTSQPEPRPSGTLTVSFTIQSTGRVSTAQVVNSPDFQGTPVGQCVVNIVRGLQFPPHTADPQVINYPFILR